MKLKRSNEAEEPSLFTRGYSSVRSRVGKGSRFTMSCYNCEHYYQASGDTTEMCQNPSVLKYDMVITENNIYCNKWELSHRDSTVKSLFKSRSKR